MQHYRFRPRRLPTALFIVLLPILISLGLWQWNRADIKYAQRDQREQNRTETVLDLNEFSGAMRGLLDRNVIMHGSFDLSRQVLLHNQKYKAQPGFLVYTPLRLQGRESAVLVCRGWIALGERLQVLPEVPGPEGTLQLSGRMDSPPSVGLKLGQPDAGSMDWPRAVTYMDLDWLNRETGYRLLPYVALQTDGEDFGLVRDWEAFAQGREKMPPEKHMSYAFQWFALALTLCLVFVLVNLRKET